MPGAPEAAAESPPTTGSDSSEQHREAPAPAAAVARAAEPDAAVAEEPAAPGDLAESPAASGEEAELGAAAETAAATDRELATRVAAVVEARESEQPVPESADALYDDVYAELHTVQRDLARSVIRWSPGIEALFVEFESLRAMRAQLVPVLSFGKRNDVTGRNLYGLRELVREFEAIALHLSYQAGAIPRSLPRIYRRWMANPLPVLWDGAVLLLSLFAFRLWRSWAPVGIPAIRERFLRAYPRKPYHMRVARVLWYADEIRIPLEWLALIAVLVSFPEAPEIRALADPLWMIAGWVLVARVAIRWINAFGRRRAWHIRSDLVALRLRSLRLIAGWIVLLGLGLGMSEYFSGRNTLYAWTWSVFRFLAVPIALLLLHWWRASIFRRLEEEAGEQSRARHVLAHREGLRSYVGALEALVLLAARGVTDWIIRTVMRVDEGRAVVSLVLGRDIDTRHDTDDRSGTEPIPPELARELLHVEGTVVESVARHALSRLVELAEGDRLSAVMITAPRGGGKSSLLARMAEQLGDKMVVVSCGHGGFEPLRAEIAEQLDLRPGWSTEELDACIVERGIEAIGIDDFHRLVRPVMGGQEGLVHFGEVVRSLRSQVLWCGAADRRTWEYIRRAGGGTARVQQMFELGSWTEAEIGALVDRRCKALELEPDFSELVLPRELGDVSHAPSDDRARFGFNRLLWQASEGNPGIAMRYLADSLRRRPDGTLMVLRPALPTADDLDEVDLTMLLLLRALVRYAQPSAEDLAATLRIPEAEVGNLLVAARTAGWVEQLDGRYRVTWRWLPAVLRILVRKNLQPR